MFLYACAEWYIGMITTPIFNYFKSEPHQPYTIPHPENFDSTYRREGRQSTLMVGISQILPCHTKLFLYSFHITALPEEYVSPAWFRVHRLIKYQRSAFWHRLAGYRRWQMIWMSMKFDSNLSHGKRLIFLHVEYRNGWGSTSESEAVCVFLWYWFFLSFLSFFDTSYFLWLQSNDWRA